MVARARRAEAGPLPELLYVVPAGHGVAPCIAGFRVEVARPSGGTLKEIARRIPALLVLDVPEGDETCLAFAARVQASVGPLVPLLALVSGDDEATFRRAYACGACRVLSAPVAPALLQVEVSRSARHVPLRPRRIAGFDVLSTLGHGATGMVYLAERGGVRVALKVLAGMTGEPEQLVRFRREAEALRSLHDPGIPRFVAAGREGEAFYCAMEFVPGEPLSDALERGPLDEPSVARIGDRIAAALQAIHAAGLVHRDVKPANVMLTPEGDAKLVDFGLAKSVADLAVTSTGEILGTAPYLAPELFRDGSPTPQADAFALGVTLLEAALGERPEMGSNYEIAARRARGLVPRAAELLEHRSASASASLAATLDGLLAPDPRRRLGLAAARWGIARSLAKAC